MNCTAACSNSVSLLLACSVCAGEVWVCQAQRNPWCCDPGERFSPVGEEPAPRQTGEPRAGAQGEKASSEGSNDPPSIRQYFICISSCLSPSILGSELRCLYGAQPFAPFPTCATLPPSGYLQLFCLMSLTCLLPSSVVLRSLTRSCERVEAWSSLPPFPFLLKPFMLSSSPWPVPSHCPPARFIRYHCYVHPLGSSSISPILNAFCPPFSGCTAYQTYEWSPGYMTTALWNVISLHEAGERVWLHDNDDVSPTGLMTLPILDLNFFYWHENVICFFHLTNIYIYWWERWCGLDEHGHIVLWRA